jgi:hypothetical protein
VWLHRSTLRGGNPQAEADRRSAKELLTDSDEKDWRFYLGVILFGFDGSPFETVKVFVFGIKKHVF